MVAAAMTVGTAIEIETAEGEVAEVAVGVGVGEEHGTKIAEMNPRPPA